MEMTTSMIEVHNLYRTFGTREAVALSLIHI